MRGLRVTKNVRAIKLERVWGKLESKNTFHGQKLAKYLRPALGFKWNSGQRLISVFREFSASINKIFILKGRLGTKLSFNGVKHFPEIS